MSLSVLQFAAGMPNWGGAEIHLLNLSEQLRLRGHHVTVACQPGRYVEARAKELGFATLPVTLARQHDRRDIPALRRYLREHPTDVLHAHAPNDFLLPPLVALLAGVPVRLMTRHFPQPLRNRLGAWIYSNLLFSRVVTVSESVRRTLIASGMSAGRVETIHHGTDVEAFAATTQTVEESRRALGVPEGAVAVGIVGRVASEKGHGYLFEAVRALGDRFRLCVVVVGDGPDDAKLRALAVEMGIADRVVFAGFRADVNNAINGLDIVAVPSTWPEPCSAAIQQGMALSKPVVGTLSGGTPEMVVEGVTGLLVPVEDAGALAGALGALACDAPLRARMGAAGRARVGSLFTLSGMTDKVEALYRREYARARGQGAPKSDGNLIMSQYPKFLSPSIACNAPMQRCPVPREHAERRILIMRTGAFGDALMATPLLAALRQAYPTAHLTWLIESRHLECVDANPYVDEIISWNGGYWKQFLRLGNVIGWAFLAFRFALQLRRRRYDVFVSFQPEEYWPLLYGIGAPVNIGVFDTFRRFNRDAATSRNVRRYQHAYVHQDLPTHRTDQYLLALDALGLPPTEDKRMCLGYTAQDAQAVGHLLAEARMAQDAPFVILAPTTTWESRNWPANRYVEVGDALARRGYHVVLVGNRRSRKRDQATLDVVLEVEARLATPPLLAMDRLSFRGLAALIDRAALVISGDTGPMHMAAALDTPFVGIFGPTAPEWYAPQVGRGIALAHPVPCGPCDQKNCENAARDHRCMRLVTAAEVLHAADLLLSAQGTVAA